MKYSGPPTIHTYRYARFLGVEWVAFHQILEIMNNGAFHPRKVHKSLYPWLHHSQGQLQAGPLLVFVNYFLQGGQNVYAKSPIL